MEAWHKVYRGSSYEIGRMAAERLIQLGSAQRMVFLDEYLGREDEARMKALFKEFCPGINEEIEGFADVLKVPSNQILYYMLSYLKCGCSTAVVLPAKTADNHTYLMRNYEFNDRDEANLLLTTAADSRYAHIGTAIIEFGRTEGMNEHGLAVGHSSTGVPPVGVGEFFRKPAITGLQFWAVVRSVLENCRTVEEAIDWTKHMPIAYNLNMTLADRSGHGALLETFDGRKAVRRSEGEPQAQYLCATNHIHLDELKMMEPVAVKHSAVRYRTANEFFEKHRTVSAEQIKEHFSRRYPQGPICHYYDEYFGTTKSMLFDATAGILHMCFGSPALGNQWHQFRISDTAEAEYSYRIEKEHPDKDFMTIIGI